MANHKITATICSKTSSYRRTLTFLVIPEIASTIPSEFIDRSTINIPRNIKLADPTFHHPARVDMLLGAGVALSLLCIGQINLSPQNGPDLYLQKTRLGWVIGGSTPVARTRPHATCHSTTALQLDIARFWEIEECPKHQHHSKAEIECEEHFRTNTIRNAEGRYVVALPFKDRPSALGESRTMALKRFLSLERRLQRDPLLKTQYHNVIQEYLDLGHMSEVKDEGISTINYYLPHHGVIKSSSDTTKLRVVFDGSARTSTGISLNDILFTGPKIQEDLLHILLRFRIHRFVITGDIEKMYRQFLTRPEDRSFQRILWRDTDGEIKAYRLNTVTFGLAAAPYLAIRCLTQLAKDEANRFPTASAILQRDFYVDDALTGASTKEEAFALREELTQLLKTAGLNVRQWASNDKGLLKGLPEQSINQKLIINETSIVKTLGIYWNSSDDRINYTVTTPDARSHFTKRTISSAIARIYDPLGLLGPVIIVAKMILQQIWTMKIDWDESLPSSIHSTWQQYYSQLPLLNNIAFRRRTVIEAPRRIELHGFSDASEKAYGACIYLRSVDIHGNVEIELLIAKSKVAPLKQLTIPRLELCGALLLAHLCKIVEKALHIQINQRFLWTDSTIVLHWLNSSPHTLKTFVANRVAEIQEKTNVSEWRHVPTMDNPADLISRGQTPEEFLQPSIWQQGPEWLAGDQLHWPTWEFDQKPEIPEQKKTLCLTTISIDTAILDRYSSWPKLIRVIARCLRWKPTHKAKGALTVPELHYAHNVIIRMVQQQHFSEELKQLNKRDTQIKGKLQRLNPFKDKDGILRVGGRLKHSTIPFSQKHPIILPKTQITRLIIENEHRTQLHSGTQTTLYAVRRRYWPIDGKSQVWKTIKTCVRCCRANPPSTDYIMGNLPAARVTESRPFTNVGVDYCGPFYIKEKRHRNRVKIKAYVAVFVCLAIKAVHLELVSDLTTEAFIAALRRFIARRGLCTTIHSDNGTNFLGANNQLRELRDLLHSDDHNNKIKSFLANRSIEWHFIPPSAPHFGGLWEAAVKSFKHHFKRVAGNETLSFENLNTLIIEIESILNSRPLTPISSDSNDFLVLTPGHFLIGDSLTGLHERDFRDIPTNRLSSWEHIQKMKQHFWTRWHREYLNELTMRNKWTKGTHDIREGTVVLLKEDHLPPMQWTFGRVIKVHPGSDGIVRAVSVKTATNVLDRSIKKLVPLPIKTDPEENS